MTDQGFMFYARHHSTSRIVIYMFLEESCMVALGYKKGLCRFGRIAGRLLQCLLIMALCYFSIQPSLIYAAMPNPVQRQSLVAMEIRYQIAEASEAYLVWGINGWALLPEATRPAGTIVKGGLMYTPMAREGAVFVAKVNAPLDATIDYVFQIVKTRDGTAVEIWDTNGAPKRDYHIVAVPGKVVEVKSTSRPAQSNSQTGGIAMGLYLLIGSFIVYGIRVIVRRLLRVYSQPGPANSTIHILCASASLCFFLFLIRAKIMGFGWRSLRSSFIIGLDFLSAGYYDLFYVGAITVLFIGLIFLARKNQKAQRLLYLVYVCVALLSLLVALINIKVIPVLGKPFTYQWLYYSDFLRSFDTKNAILSNISWKLFWNSVGLCVAMVIASYLLKDCIDFLRKYQHRRVVAVTLMGVLLIYFPLANLYISKRHWDRSKLVNPLTFFFQSIIQSHASPALFSMKLPAGFEEFSAVADGSSKALPIKDRTNTRLRNVLIFVLESVPREYLEAYGGQYPVTPELTKYLKHAALFENIYAHAPATNKALVPMLCSTYPWISYLSLTQEYPAVSLPSLSEELKKHGYRTAFFNAGDNRFQGTEAFLSHRQLDRLEDQRSLNCNREKFIGSTEEWPFLDGIDDECIVDSVTEWIKNDSEKPFFAMLWTYMTHYPYFVAGKEADFHVGDKLFNRYLNALYHDDKSLGKLLRFLEKRNLLESTLVVVVGDHGEAFGQHEQFIHASKIYEENLHVPLVLVNPKLFKGEKYAVIGGLVDLAPTIMNILNFPAPGEWQGRSLFSSHEDNRVYFFAPWSSFLFGYRDGNLKFIFDATHNTCEVYDLLKDPKETTNLANLLPDFVSVSQLRLAAWVQAHDRFMKMRFANSSSIR